jgi:hypothetical protein
MADHMGNADMAEVGINELDEYRECTTCHAPIFDPDQLNCKTCGKALIGLGCDRWIRHGSKDRAAQSEVAWKQERQWKYIAELAAGLDSDYDNDDDDDSEYDNYHSEDEDQDEDDNHSMVGSPTGSSNSSNSSGKRELSSDKQEKKGKKSKKSKKDDEDKKTKKRPDRKHCRGNSKRVGKRIVGTASNLVDPASDLGKYQAGVMVELEKKFKHPESGKLFYDTSNPDVCAAHFKWMMLKKREPMGKVRAISKAGKISCSNDGNACRYPNSYMVKFMKGTKFPEMPPLFHKEQDFLEDGAEEKATEWARTYAQSEALGKKLDYKDWATLKTTQKERRIDKSVTNQMRGFYKYVELLKEENGSSSSPSPAVAAAASNPLCDPGSPSLTHEAAGAGNADYDEDDEFDLEAALC